MKFGLCNNQNKHLKRAINHRDKRQLKEGQKDHKSRCVNEQGFKTMVSTTGQQEHNENAEQLGGTNFVTTKETAVSAFGVACDVDAYEAARMSSQKAEDFTIAEQGRMVREGNLSPDQVTSCKAFANVAQKRGDNLRKENKAKATADAIFLAMIEQLRDDIARMDREIADLDADLRNKYGDDYIVDAAVDILGELPDRLPNEGDAAYEARLIDLYGDEMIDGNGDLKDDYKNHPDQRIRDLADRVKLDYDRDKAKVHVNNLESGDPALVKATTEDLKKTENYQAALETRDSFEKGSENQIIADNASDVASDQGISESYKNTDVSSFSLT